jgi:invasion protein IalB
MIDLKLTLALILTAALSTAATAQTTGTPATDPAPADAATTDAPAADSATTEKPADNGLSLGQEVTDVGQNYTREPFDQWQLNCMRVEAGKPEPCQLYQLLKDSAGNSVAEINIVALKPGQDAVMGATIITPLETLLTENLTIAIDGSKAKRYPFTFCAAIGCIARVGFTAGELDGFKKGAKATISVVPVAAPDKKVEVSISLKGFTAGFEAVTKANAESAPTP